MIAEMYYPSVVLVGNISKEKVVDFIYLAISVKDMRFKGLLLSYYVITMSLEIETPTGWLVFCIFSVKNAAKSLHGLLDDNSEGSGGKVFVSLSIN